MGWEITPRLTLRLDATFSTSALKKNQNCPNSDPFMGWGDNWMCTYSIVNVQALFINMKVIYKLLNDILYKDLAHINT